MVAVIGWCLQQKTACCWNKSQKNKLQCSGSIVGKTHSSEHFDSQSPTGRGLAGAHSGAPADFVAAKCCQMQVFQYQQSMGPLTHLELRQWMQEVGARWCQLPALSTNFHVDIDAIDIFSRDSQEPRQSSQKRLFDWGWGRWTNSKIHITMLKGYVPPQGKI